MQLVWMQDENAHLNGSGRSETDSEGEEEEDGSDEEEDAELGDEESEPEDEEYMQRLAKEAMKLKVMVVALMHKPCSA